MRNASCAAGRRRICAQSPLTGGRDIWRGPGNCARRVAGRFLKVHKGGTFYSGDKCRYFSAAQRHKSLGFAPWKPCFARCSRASHSIGRGPCPTELPARIRPSSHSLQGFDRQRGPLFVSWRRLKCFRRQTGQRWKAQALNVGGGVSALVVLLHLAHLVGSEEGLQVVHLSLELTADIGL